LYGCIGTAAEQGEEGIQGRIIQNFIIPFLIEINGKGEGLRRVFTVDCSEVI